MSVSNVIKRVLPVPINEEQKMHRAMKLVSLMRDLDQRYADAQDAVDQAKAAQNKIKEECKEDEKEVLRLRRVVLTGYEDMDIECTEERDFDRGLFVLRRNDTWEIIDERKMNSSSDRQETIFESSAPNVVPIDKKARKKKKEGQESAQTSETVTPVQPSTDGADLSRLKSSGFILSHFKAGDALIISLELDGQVRHITGEDAEKKFISSKNPDVMEDYRSFDALQEAGLKAVQELAPEALQSLFNELSESTLYKSSDDQASASESPAEAKEEPSSATIDQSEISEISKFVLVAPVDRGVEGAWWRLIKDGQIVEVPSLTIYQLLGSTAIELLSPGDLEAQTKQIINEASQAVLLGLWKELNEQSVSKRFQEQPNSQAEIDAEMMAAAAYKLSPPIDPKAAIKARKRPDGTAVLVNPKGESLELSTMRVQLIERGWQVDDAIFIKGEVQKLSQDQLEVIWRVWVSDATSQSKGQSTNSPKGNKNKKNGPKGPEASR